MSEKEANTNGPPAEEPQDQDKEDFPQVDNGAGDTETNSSDAHEELISLEDSGVESGGGQGEAPRRR